MNLSETTQRLVTADRLDGLPEPVQRYLVYTGVVGKPWINTVRIRYAGRFRMARQARDTLLNEYGWFTYQIAMGDAPSLLGTRSVAAVRANINRPGHLHDLVKSCNF